MGVCVCACVPVCMGVCAHVSARVWGNTALHTPICARVVLGTYLADKPNSL